MQSTTTEELQARIRSSHDASVYTPHAPTRSKNRITSLLTASRLFSEVGRRHDSASDWTLARFAAAAPPPPSPLSTSPLSASPLFTYSRWCHGWCSPMASPRRRERAPCAIANTCSPACLFSRMQPNVPHRSYSPSKNRPASCRTRSPSLTSRTTDGVATRVAAAADPPTAPPTDPPTAPQALGGNMPPPPRELAEG